ncbi:MAG: PorP/SprF family type IX secretion system membrane protein [Ferruginibacter sp.]
MKLLSRIVLLMMVMNSTVLHAQDILLSQYYAQPLLRNPALAGVFTGDIRAVASYRNQWQSITDPYRTFGLSTEIKMPINILADDNLTIGLQLIKDVAGTSQLSQVQVMPALNYSILLSGERNSYLSLAFMGGFMQQKFDPTKLVLNDQFITGANGSFSIAPASNQAFTNTDVSYRDLAVGLSYNGELNGSIDYFIGGAMFHVARPNVAFFESNTVKLNRKLTVNAGMSIASGEFDELILYGDYFRQGGNSTVQGGFMYRHDLYVSDDDRKGITGGVLYRWNDAVIPVLQLELSNFNIGASYDVNVSKLVKASQYRGGVEITLAYKNFLNVRKSELRTTRCPRFGN